MNVVVDTNIIISALLNIDSNIAGILLDKKNKFQFFAISNLKEEVQNHKAKIVQYSGFTNTQFNKTIKILYSEINFIPIDEIPNSILFKSRKLTKDIDFEDMHFVALAIHLKIKLWTGDKKLITGLKAIGFERLITTQELYKYTYKKI